MSIVKESSDDSKSQAAVAEVARAKRSAKDYLALAIATCGVGYLPLAPGTWGSLLAVGFYFLMRVLVYSPLTTDVDRMPTYRTFVFVELVTIAVVTIAGIWAGSRVERGSGVKDPGKVVIDEVAGQLIALLPVPLTVGHPWPLWFIPAFLFFRFFDIVKPYPARKLESLHGGLGIMADDLIAGIYAAIVVALLVVIRSFM
jgi:phosphatidylglycerophosphatase A